MCIKTKCASSTRNIEEACVLRYGRSARVDMNKFLIFIVFSAVVGYATCADQDGADSSIDGLHRYNVYGDDKTKLDLVRQYEDNPHVDFLRVPSDEKEPVDFLVDQKASKAVSRNLREKNVNFRVINKNFDKVLDASAERPAAFKQRSFDFNFENFPIWGSKKTFPEEFPRYKWIKEYVEKLAQEHSDIVSTFSMGKSYEGRDLFGVKFSSGGGDKPALFIDAGIHAREWIAPSTAVYAIKELAENPNNRHVFKNVDIYIVPLLNPDGYEYSHGGGRARLWRKTRSPQTWKCKGVDANRNFGFNWMLTGASDDPCSITYAGPKAFSEVETQALRDFLLAHKDHIKVYLSLHAFGQYMLYPWGYKSETPENEPTLKCVAGAAERELSKVRGTTYKIGSSTNLLYPAAGGSDDWAMGVAGIELAYTIELPGGYYGFAPPASDIIPVGKETFEAFKVFAKYANNEVCSKSDGLYF